MALDAGVRRLVLTHISPRYTRDAPELLAEARAVFPGDDDRAGRDDGRGAVRGVRIGSSRGPSFESRCSHPSDELQLSPMRA